MRALVTGAAGFIGSELVRTLLSAQVDENGEVGAERVESAESAESAESEGGSALCERVLSYDSLSYAGNLANLAEFAPDSRHHFVQADICEQQRLAELLEEEQITHLFHLAAESHVDRSLAGPKPCLESNTVGSYHVLEALRSRESKGQSIRLIHISTDEVYGSLSRDQAALKEGSSYAPNNPYAATKAASDMLVRAWSRSYDLDCVTTHSANNYGPRQHPEKLIPKSIHCALKGRPIPMYGDGSQRRSWIHVQDNARALLLCALHGHSKQSYHIAGSMECSNRQLLSQLLKILREQGVDSATEKLIQSTTDRPAHDTRYALDASKLRALTGWQPQIPFANGLRDTVKWYVDNQ